MAYARPSSGSQVLKYIEVKWTSSCIIDIIGSSTFSNLPFYVFEIIDDICVTGFNNFKCFTTTCMFYLNMFLKTLCETEDGIT